MTLNRTVTSSELLNNLSNMRISHMNEPLPVKTNYETLPLQKRLVVSRVNLIQLNSIKFTLFIPRGNLRGRSRVAKKSTNTPDNQATHIAITFNARQC